MNGLWVGNHTYHVTDPLTGESENVIILATPDEMADPIYMQEQTHLAREWVARDRKKRQPKPPSTRNQRRELGTALASITASKHRRRETGHGRWF